MSVLLAVIGNSLAAARESDDLTISPDAPGGRSTRSTTAARGGPIWPNQRWSQLAELPWSYLAEPGWSCLAAPRWSSLGEPQVVLIPRSVTTRRCDTHRPNVVTTLARNGDKSLLGITWLLRTAEVELGATGCEIIASVDPRQLGKQSSETLLESDDPSPIQPARGGHF
jgi:hypothetical protein